jgi:hypothetical protein
VHSPGPIDHRAVKPADPDFGIADLVEDALAILYLP